MAWLLDTSTDIDEVVMGSGTHVLIRTDMQKSVICGDDSSVLHVDAGHTLLLGNTLGARTIIEEASILVMADDAGLTLTRPTILYGTLTSLNSEENNLYIEDVFKIRPQTMNLTSLIVTATGNMTTTHDEIPLSMAVTNINIEGNFKAAEVRAIGWETFTVGENGVVTFDPVSHDEYLGPHISIRGDVTLLKTVSVVLPCDKFEIDTGTLVMVGAENVTIECSNVTINGVFKPQGAVDVGAGLPTFHVGPLGHFVFTLNGDFICDNLDVSGVMTSLLPIVMRGRVRDNIHSINIGNSGYLTLDFNSQDLHNWTDVSKIGAHSISIYGAFRPGLLSITDIGVDGGWDYLFINASGSMKFDPASSFLCDVMEINGHFESHKPLVLRAHKGTVELTLLVGGVGCIHLDSNANHPSGPWSNYSMITGGHFLTEGPESNVQLGEARIQVKTISIGGHFMVDPSTDIQADTLEVTETGRIEIPKPVVFSGVSGPRVANITLGGYVKLDTAADHFLRNWSLAGGSVFNADNIMVGPAADLYLGLLTQGIRWESFSEEAGANMEFEPLDRFLITDSVIGGRVKSLVPIDYGRHLEGTTLTLLNTGTLDIDYRGLPNKTGSGCLPSYIEMDNVVVSGMIQAGSLTIQTRSMEVTAGGSLDVSGGGYLGEYGPGKPFTDTETRFLL